MLHLTGLQKLKANSGLIAIVMFSLNSKQVKGWHNKAHHLARKRAGLRYARRCAWR